MSQVPFRPAKLADALRAYVSATPGLAQRLAAASVVDRWAEAVGPQIAAVTQARSVGADGTLFVDVTTNAWMQELRLMEAELLGRLASAEGPGPRVTRIRWTLARK